MTPYALIGSVKDATEQGEWAAQTALKILDGTPVSDIPMVENKRYLLILNRKIAKASGVEFPQDLVSSAVKVIE